MSRAPCEPPPECPRLAGAGDGPRRCAHLACRYHLAELGHGSDRDFRRRLIRLAMAPEHCALDRAARGESTCAEVARQLGIHRSVVRRTLRSRRVRATLVILRGGNR